jgi:Tfp pilus assembly protein PilO
MKHVVFLLLAVALPPVAYYNTLGAKRAKQIETDSIKFKELDVRVEQARAAKNKLSQFHEESARLAEELAKLRRILPPAMDIDGIRALAEEKASARGMKLTRFDVRENQSIDAQVVGPAAATSEFFSDIANAPRIIDVTYVTLKKDPGGWRTDFVMTSYAMPDSPH